MFLSIRGKSNANSQFDKTKTMALIVDLHKFVNHDNNQSLYLETFITVVLAGYILIQTMCK